MPLSGDMLCQKVFLSRSRRQFVELRIKLFIRFDQMIEALADAPCIRRRFPVDLLSGQAAEAVSDVRRDIGRDPIDIICHIIRRQSVIACSSHLLRNLN